MIRIAPEPWEVMLAHARRAYPNECCGAMLGSAADGAKDVREALPLENAFAGEQGERYELRPEDLLAADRAARERRMELIGIYHSHPDCDAYFSETDLKNSCPWYSFLVLSIRYGFYHHANSWLPDVELTGAVKEELIVQRAAASSPPRLAVDGPTAADRWLGTEEPHAQDPDTDATAAIHRKARCHRSFRRHGGRGAPRANHRIPRSAQADLHR